MIQQSQNQTSRLLFLAFLMFNISMVEATPPFYNGKRIHTFVGPSHQKTDYSDTVLVREENIETEEDIPGARLARIYQDEFEELEMMQNAHIVNCPGVNQPENALPVATFGVRKEQRTWGVYTPTCPYKSMIV